MKQQSHRALNRRQELFCLKYVELNGNGTQAYVAVYGTDEESSRRLGSKLLTRVDVKARINELTEVNDKNEIVTIAEIARELRSIGFAKGGTLGGPKYSDKAKALELLGKYKGMYTEKVEHGGKDGSPIRIIIDDYGVNRD